MFFLFVFVGLIKGSHPVDIDTLNCGVDNEESVQLGDVPISTYPWLGVLYYTLNNEGGEMRSFTPVALIHTEFVMGIAADIDAMPKHDFSSNAKVLLGEGWNGVGRKVKNHVLHPEFDKTHFTVALVQLGDIIYRGNKQIRPLCPPPEFLRNPIFYVVKIKEEVKIAGSDEQVLQKQVLQVEHVPGSMCKAFYEAANLYQEKSRPSRVACAVELNATICVWNSGALLVSRDAWGRWHLLGFGVRGPGCGGPSRYLDVMSYFPWIERTLSKFQRITISKISGQKYVLRSGNTLQKFGDCDEGEQKNLVYRESFRLNTDNDANQFFTYNMSILEEVEFSCLTLQLINATGFSDMTIRHRCTRFLGGPPCYAHNSTSFHISVRIKYTGSCYFEMYAYGFKRDMVFLDIMEWKWEEATFYEDFNLVPTEYRGPFYQSLLGFEPLDDQLWAPHFDVYSTTPASEVTTAETIQPGQLGGGEPIDQSEGYFYQPTTNLISTTSTTTWGSRRTWRTKSKPPTTTEEATTEETTTINSDE